MVIQPTYEAHNLSEGALAHLWLHFTRMGSLRKTDLPIITRGEGCYVTDVYGNRYLDALSGLFTVNIGYSFGDEIGKVAADQLRELPYYSNWSYAHPPSIQLAELLASLAPKDLGRVFFVSTGSEAVETAWKLARQYHRAHGQHRWKVIARETAYHGTTLGALSITGIQDLRTPFEPLVPDVIHVKNTNRYRRPASETHEEFVDLLIEDIEHSVDQAGPETIAMIIMEPVQNAGGALTPPLRYFERVREVCDRYGILLCIDEVISAFGRFGRWFASERYDIKPDLMTVAKGISSGYGPMGAVVAREAIVEPFQEQQSMFLHGTTFGGHPVQAAIGIKNIEIMNREGMLGHVRVNESRLKRGLETLLDIPIVGDVRGAGYFYAVELVKEKSTKQTFDEVEREELLRNFLSGRLYERGLICRADDRGEPVIMIAPPLVAAETEFEEIVGILGDVLSEASRRRA